MLNEKYASRGCPVTNPLALPLLRYCIDGKREKIV